MSASDDELDLTVGAPEPPEVDVSPVSDDPDAPPGEGPVAGPPAVVLVDEVMVRRLLRVAGDAAHAMSGEVGQLEPEFLRFTDGELDALTPPLTAYINARPRLAERVQRGDGVAVVLTLFGWSGRNLAALRRYRETIEEDTDGDERGETAGPVGPAGAGTDGVAGKLGALARARAGHDGRAAGEGSPREVPGAAG